MVCNHGLARQICKVIAAKFCYQNMHWVILTSSYRREPVSDLGGNMAGFNVDNDTDCLGFGALIMVPANKPQTPRPTQNPVPPVRNPRP